MHVNSKLKAQETRFSTTSKENIWCTLNLANYYSGLLLGCIYRSRSTDKENTQSLCNLLQEVIDSNLSHIFIAGDLNFS